MFNKIQFYHQEKVYKLVIKIKVRFYKIKMIIKCQMK
jgi:hypothetical protein